MNILFLVEGDAETRHAWSGIGQSVVSEIRRAGHQVITADVDLHGVDRWIAAARVFSPNRKRWGVKYRLLAEPALRRSRNAEAVIRRLASEIDLIFQIGASFRPLGRGTLPYVLYCDSSIRAAERGLRSGFSPAQWLDPSEIEIVCEREAEVYTGAALVFSTSELLTKSFIEDFHLAEGTVKTVFGGPNFDFVEHPPPADGGEKSVPTILFVGGQFERKGGDILVQAFRNIRTRIPSARLVIVGPESLPVDDEGIEWLGFLNKQVAEDRQRLEEAFRSATVFCLPTWFEPTGMVFFEAMSFGLPCVGTSNSWGAVSEIIIDGETGYTVQAGDVEALTVRLEHLLENPELARRMGAAGRVRAETHYSWPAVVGKMLAFIDELPLTRHQSQSS
jgi:glycosyltransferase involved in cell wall biosynthesis